MPGDKLPKGGLEIPHIDKIVHFGLFYIMSIFLCAELKYQTKLSMKKVMLISIILVALYGAIIELLQNYVFTYRSGDYYDLLFDIIGGTVGVLMFKTLKSWKDRIVEKEPFCRYPFLKKIL
jgi:VanZ family protein